MSSFPLVDKPKQTVDSKMNKHVNEESDHVRNSEPVNVLKDWIWEETDKGS